MHEPQQQSYNMSFKVDWLGRFDTVSIDSLKVVYADDDVSPNSARFAVNPAPLSNDTYVSLQGMQLPLPDDTLTEVTLSRSCQPPINPSTYSNEFNDLCPIQ